MAFRDIAEKCRVEDIVKCKKWSSRKLRQIKLAFERGDLARVARLERSLLRSRSYRVYCANRARVRLKKLAIAKWRDAGNVGDVPHYPSREDAINSAQSVHLWQPTDEPVGVTLLEKSSGRTMRIYPPALERRTRDEMLSLVLRNRARVHPSQYAPRQGLRALETDVTSAIGAGEYKWAFYTDIVDCFGHVTTSSLPSLLRIPPRVVDCNVGFEHLHIDNRQLESVRKEEARHLMREPDKDDDELMATRLRQSKGYSSHIRTVHGQWGIPRGPSSSPIIAEYAIAQCLNAVLEDVKVFTWVDDILILAKTREAGERAFLALRAAFKASPHGSFVLRRPAPRRVADGVEFVGFRFQRRVGRTCVEPAKKNIRKFKIEMGQRLAKLQASGEGHDLAIKHLKAWLSVYERWEKSEHWRMLYSGAIAHARSLHRQFYQKMTLVEADVLMRTLRWGFRNGRRSIPPRVGSYMPLRA